MRVVEWGIALFTAFWATEKIGLPRPENKVDLFDIDGHWSLMENQTRKSMTRSISETGAGLPRGNKGGRLHTGVRFAIIARRTSPHHGHP